MSRGLKAWAALAVLLACLGAARSESRVDRLSELDDARQLVLVEYLGGTTALVTRQERIDGQWIELDATWGYVGRAGMGKTRAGDNKTPLGVYRLTTPFGILEDPGAAQPYTQATEDHYWCSTSGSEYYNQLVDAGQTGRRARGADEVLIDYAGFYDYAMFIDYNAEGAPGRGACIFLHCIAGRDWTHGCIAVPEDYMRTVVRWAEWGVRIAILEAPLEDMPGGPLVTTDRAWLRDGPGAEYAAVDSLPAYQRADYRGRVELGSDGALWYCVNDQGRECWISERQAAVIGG